MTRRTLGLAAMAVAAFAAPAAAHHSFAMFDFQKTVSLRGTVTELEWRNPHAWLRILVPDETGTQRQYALEMGSVRRSMLDGWRQDTVKPGDVVTVTMHPLKDGSRGGMYLSAILPDGRQLGRTGPAVGLPDPEP